MSKTLRQRIFEDTGYDMLSPISIARDQRLRVLYETYTAAKDTPQEEQPTKRSSNSFGRNINEQK